MAFETEQGNTVNPTDVVSDSLAAGLAQQVVAVPLIHSEGLPERTNLKKFAQDGVLTAETVAESTAYTFSANGELTQTSSTATATKKMVSSKITAEQLQFGTQTPSSIAGKQGAALGRALDAEIYATFPGFTAQVGTTSTALALDDLIDAAFTVGDALGGDGQLVGIFDRKAISEVRKAVEGSSGTAYGNDAMAALVRDLLQSATETPNGFVTHFSGIDLYQTQGLTLVNASADDAALVFNPANALAGIYSDAPNFWVSNKGSEGVYQEVTSWIFSDAVMWVDEGGCEVISAT